MEWVVEKPGADPVIYQSWEAAQKALGAEVRQLWHRYRQMGYTAVCDRLERISDEVAGLPREGGGINMVADPTSGLRYQVTLRRRGIPETARR